MKLKYVIFLAISTVLFSACTRQFAEIGSIERTQTADSFRKIAQKESFESKRRFDEIAKDLNKYAYKCLNKIISGATMGDIYVTPTLKGDNNSGSLYVQYDDGLLSADTDGDNGFYTLIMDFRRMKNGKAHIDIYNTPDWFEDLPDGAKAWIEGRRGCFKIADDSLKD